MIAQSLVNLKLNSTGREDDEISSFARSCYFCLTWKAGGGGICSIWSCNLKNILKVFFKLNSPASVYYFPPDGGRVIEIFNRGGRDEEVTRQINNQWN